MLELVDKVRPPGEPASGVVVSAAGPVVTTRVAVVHQLYRLVSLLAPGPIVDDSDRDECNESCCYERLFHENESSLSDTIFD